MAEKDAMELRDYLRVLRRRKLSMAVGFSVVVGVAVIFAMTMPKTYRSTATIQIERQLIPEQWIAGPAFGYMDERLHTLSRRVQSEESLRPIAEKYSLFEPGWETGTGWLRAMRSAISVEKVDIEVTDPNRARTMLVTVAFNVSFEGPTPEVAQQVTEELAKLYMQDNERRRNQAVAVADYLAAEADRLSRRVGAIEQKLATFKSKNIDRLPELTPVNRNLYERTLGDVAQTREVIRNLEQRRIDLRTRIAKTPRDSDVYDQTGRRVSTLSERLRLLRTEYARISSLYSPDHPDVLRIENEIASLEAAGEGVPSNTVVLARQIEQLKLELAETRRKHSREHPDVVRLERQLSAYESELANSSSSETADLASTPTNPSYITLQGETAAVDADLRTQRTKLDQLQQLLRDYEQRLVASPGVEQEYQVLVRERESVSAKFREVSDKLLEAQMLSQLEGDNKGDRFFLVEPARLPINPKNPQPFAIILFGTFLGFASGVGTAAFREYWDRGVRGREGVRAIFDEPPLVVMPYVENVFDMRGQKRRRYLLRGGLMLLLAGGGGLWLYFSDAEMSVVMPESSTAADGTTLQGTIERPSPDG